MSAITTPWIEMGMCECVHTGAHNDVIAEGKGRSAQQPHERSKFENFPHHSPITTLVCTCTCNSNYITIRLGCHYNTTVTSLPLCLTIVLQLYHHSRAVELAEDKDLIEVVAQS